MTTASRREQIRTRDIDMDNREWDEEVDILVIGSGAGGLTVAVSTAAQGASALVVEKGRYYGGSSATSGGVVWIPASRSALEQGQQDSAEEAFTYIKSLTGNRVADEKIRAFTTNGPTMLDHIEALTDLRFTAIPYTDYHAESPGGKMGYRSHQPNTLNARRLTTADFETLRPTHPAAALFDVIPWTATEAAPMVTRGPGWLRKLARVVLRYYADVPQRLRSRRSRFLVFGNAIAGHLKNALNRYGGRLWLEAPLVGLLKEHGRVVGAVVTHQGRTKRIRARKGVVIAAGGFERNQAMRDRYLPGEGRPEWSAGQEDNCGDAIVAGTEIGAATDLMDEAWWAPTVSVPGETRGRPLFYERALPGSIIVNQAGERYMNEARSYDVAGKAMIDADRPERRTIPSWIVFDARFRRKYPMGPLRPFLPDWVHSRAVNDMIHRSATLAGLARKMEVPPEALVATVLKVNVYAATGIDEEFGRGNAAYDRYYGDLNVAPNPNLAPIDRAPFYAMRVYPGDIGTKGGLATDERARVIDREGRVIPGLYAIGNSSASVMGPAYPGAGSTIGPAMTFGMLAVRDALGQDVVA
jgi:3-oxosteroid 1-dehydrogenase